MNLKQRTIRTTAAFAIGAAALLTVAACQSAGGQAVAASQAAAASAQTSISDAVIASTPESSPPTSGAAASFAVASSQSVATTSPGTTNLSSAAPTTTSEDGPDGGSGSGSGSGPAGGGGSGSGGGSGGGSHTKSAPSSPDPRFVSASAACELNNDDGEYHLIVSWELANATGMALSVDNPGLVGSYGTYSWHGSEDLANLGCYTDDRVQDIELYSTGGNGNQAKKTFHVHENHRRISPPPFANHTDDPSTRTTQSTPTTTATTQTSETETAASQ